VVDYVRKWSVRADLPLTQLVSWLGIERSKYYQWGERYGKVNEHNAWIPRDNWLLDDERQSIIQFHLDHPLEGYRRLTYMMMDANVVAVSATSVWRVLSEAGMLKRGACTPSKKGTGFIQPLKPHEHWHVDVSYLNISGTFYYLCCLLDGYSRAIVHWDIREQMTEADIETIIEGGRERNPGATPRIISDNGPQFIAKDFKEYIRHCGMTHVRTSPYYPQSNGKIERFHKSIKSECIRPRTPLDLGDAKRIVGEYVIHYNEVRLHSAIGYITPKDHLAGRGPTIQTERDRKLETARQHRAEERRLKKPA
jgi:transposase InsO family protein